MNRISNSLRSGRGLGTWHQDIRKAWSSTPYATYVPTYIGATGVCLRQVDMQVGDKHNSEAYTNGIKSGCRMRTGPEMARGSLRCGTKASILC
ncbi:hypothetical protein J1614_009911 [Plenodomus biglobosus]|nr:hypothetical protein J1614_009911 [Plenodomus biglobosus]